MRELGVRAFGVNCCFGFASAVAALAAVSPGPEEILIAKPSAGLPLRTPSGFRYPEAPGSIGGSVRSLMRQGVSWIGGCCGTTPEHIKEIVNFSGV